MVSRREKKQTGITPFTWTDKRRDFCEQFLIDRDGAKAARRAGFSEKSADKIASELMEYPQIRSYIQELMDERSRRTNITADYVINTVKDTIERCRQAEPVMEWDPIAKEMVRTGEWKFDANAVLRGCDMLGKHLKLWDQPPPPSIINLNFNEMSNEDLDKQIEAFEKLFKK
jgi:phage terminase small subunit